MVGTHKLAGTWRKRVSTYIAVSEFARDIYIAGGLPANKITVKPNFIHPSPPPGNGGGGYALYVGRLSQEKGIATMLNAWKAAHKAIPLKIVGEGTLAELVVAATHECKSIEYLGAKPLPEVLNLMRNAEFLVFPSEWYETMGRTIMEAFAVGTPVVATNIGPPGTMVTQGVTGFHFTPGNVSELRERAEWCSQNLYQVRAMRPRARQVFENQFTGAANARMLLEIYERARKAAGHAHAE
jgi:glycosyltransferase involved in cell wall biosynthesis